MTKGQQIVIYAIISIVFFIVGNIFGYNRCVNKYIDDYTYQNLQIDSMNKKANTLEKTFDSIKESSCYKKYEQWKTRKR